MSVAPTVSRQVGGEGLILSLAGDWTVANSAALEERAASLAGPARQATGAILDLSAVNRMDTAGAWAIDRARVELADAGVKADYRGARPEYALLLKEAGYQPIEPPKPTHAPTAISLLNAVGELVYTAGYDLAEGVSFFGQLVAMTIRLLPFPHRWRWTSTAYQLEMYSLRSVPIIVLINFLVGAIVMQQGIFQLRVFGASAYAVNLVGVLGLRELALADDRDHDRRPHGFGDHRRNRLDGHARGDRRPQGDGARSARGLDHAAAGRAGDRPAGADLRRATSRNWPAASS